jgi:hypothetical protein
MRDCRKLLVMDRENDGKSRSKDDLIEVGCKISVGRWLNTDRINAVLYLTEQWR